MRVADYRDVKKDLDYSDPFRYDPIANFKKMDSRDQMRCMQIQQRVIWHYELEYKRLKGIYGRKLEELEQERSEKLLYETREELFDAYLISEIDDNTYAEQVKLMSKGLPSRWVLPDLLTWYEMMLKEQYALQAEFKQIRAESKPNVKPDKYGYDPRKNVSKYNYPREDWGQTRKNLYHHKKRKGAI